MTNDSMTQENDQPASPAELVLFQRKAFESAVTLRAWSDPAFAEQLQQDPVAAINAAFGIELPADLAVQVHHETPTTLHLAVPPAPVISESDDELTEDDLERVAGGAGFVASLKVVSVASAVGSFAASAAVPLVSAGLSIVSYDKVKNR